MTADFSGNRFFAQRMVLFYPRPAADGGGDYELIGTGPQVLPGFQNLPARARENHEQKQEWKNKTGAAAEVTYSMRMYQVRTHWLSPVWLRAELLFSSSVAKIFPPPLTPRPNLHIHAQKKDKYDLFISIFKSA